MSKLLDKYRKGSILSNKELKQIKQELEKAEQALIPLGETVISTLQYIITLQGPINIMYYARNLHKEEK